MSITCLLNEINIINDEITHSTPIMYLSKNFYSNKSDFFSNEKDIHFSTTFDEILEDVLNIKSTRDTLYLYAFKLNENATIYVKDIILKQHKKVAVIDCHEKLVQYFDDTFSVELDPLVFDPIFEMNIVYNPLMTAQTGDSFNFWDLTDKQRIQWIFGNITSKLRSVLLISILYHIYPQFHGCLKFDDKNRYFVYLNHGVLCVFYCNDEILKNICKNDSTIVCVFAPGYLKLELVLLSLNYTEKSTNRMYSKYYHSDYDSTDTIVYSSINKSVGNPVKRDRYLKRNTDPSIYTSKQIKIPNKIDK